MKKTVFRLIAVCLALCVLLSGCGVIDLDGYFDRLSSMMGYSTTRFDDMQYVRPDVDRIEDAQAKCIDMASDKDTKIKDLAEQISEYFLLYTDFSTNYYLAYIHYNIDMSDIYWEKEYNYCAETVAAVDGGRDRLLHALADSNHRESLESEQYFGEGYFDAFDGESTWDEAFTALMEQEAALQSEYYRLAGEAMAVEYYSDAYFEQYGPQLADLYVKMIGLRQQIAAQAGYSDYPTFAYEFYHHRDYSVTEATEYLKNIEVELSPLYRKLNATGFWDQSFSASSEKQTYQYVRQMSAAMGGMIQDAFELMDEGGLYHIGYGKNKFSGSFELYLLKYNEPFVFVSPSGTVQDKLTFAHEFGHFCSDYASFGSSAGVDVAEVFSQGMEYLSLCYGDDTAEAAKLKMADSLCVYVEQAAYAAFEHQVYDLTGDALTAENVHALYEKICTAYGFDSMEMWDSRDYVAVSHFFTSPMYVISYVVSNDAAMQLYQMEQAEKGSGLTCYSGNLATEETRFLAFLKIAGLKSPFAQERIPEVKSTLQKVLG